MRAGLRQRGGASGRKAGLPEGQGAGRRGATHPLQHDDVAVRELLPSHRVHHVLANQLLHALQGDHRPTVVKMRVGGEDQGPRPRQWATPTPTASSMSLGCPLDDSRGPQHGARRGVAQAVAGHGAHVALAARDEPHAVHGAVQRREAHRRQVGHAQRLPGHGAGHDARLGVGVGEGGRVSRRRWSQVVGGWGGGLQDPGLGRGSER